MNIITHALMGWCAGQYLGRNLREKGLITIASVVPDIDGLGAVVDVIRGGEAVLFTEYHHKIGHGWPFLILLLPIVYFVSRRSWRTVFWCAAIFHLHLLSDIIGARGPDGYQWPVYYFYPFSEFGITWQGQWQINAWPNFVITVALIVVLLKQAVTTGVTPFAYFSTRANDALVKTIRKRLKYGVEAKKC